MSHLLKRVGYVFMAVILVGLGFGLGTAVIRTHANTLPVAPVVFSPQEQTAPDPVTENERIFSDIYTRVSPSVVSISVAGEIGQQEFAAGGTGFVYDQQGHIVTNNHVVEGADDIEVNFLDGTVVRAAIVGLDPDSDLAVIRVNLPASQLFPVSLGDSNTLFIGETALAIGSPFGQRWTLTTGIISALDRTIQGQTRYSVGSVIQTDAAINPGNSGGPLLNLQGQLIGVNSQILSESRSNSGIGFAIPSNLVSRVVPELIANGEVQYSYLGIEADTELSLAAIEAFDLPNNLRGVLVTNVRENGPAFQAGIRGLTNRSADIITAIDGVRVDDFSTLISYLSTQTRPGQQVNLTIFRDGRELILPVTLTARP
jgi:2-alkenal reductase